MPDYAPWQDEEYRRLHFDPADPTLGDGHRRPIPADVSAAVAAAADSAKVPCPECPGKFYGQAHLKGHRRKRHGA